MCNKKIISLAFVCMAMLPAHAQKRAELNRQMTEIKQSPMYLWAEATNEDIDKAFAEAQNGLNEAATGWIAIKLGSAQVKIESKDTDKCANWMNTRRGNSMRTFIFCKKTDLVSSKAILSKVTLTAEERGEKVAEEPEIVIPPLPEAPKPTDTPVATVVVKETPKIGFSQQVVQDVVAAKDMYRMKEVFADYKWDPRFEYGRYEGGLVPDECYLLFYDGGGKIKGVLHKVGTKVEEASTKTATSLSSYAVWRGYWFTVTDR